MVSNCFSKTRAWSVLVSLLVCWSVSDKKGQLNTTAPARGCWIRETLTGWKVGWSVGFLTDLTKRSASLKILFFEGAAVCLSLGVDFLASCSYVARSFSIHRSQHQSITWMYRTVGLAIFLLNFLSFLSLY